MPLFWASFLQHEILMANGNLFKLFHLFRRILFIGYKCVSFFKWTCLTQQTKIVLRKSTNLCNDFLLFYVRIFSNMRNNQLFLLDKLKWWKLCLIIESIHWSVSLCSARKSSTGCHLHPLKLSDTLRNQSRREQEETAMLLLSYLCNFLWTVCNVILEIISYLKNQDVGMFWCLKLKILDFYELLSIWKEQNMM